MAHRPLAALALGALGAVLTSCSPVDALCDTPECEFSSEEWARVASLANPADPPPDRSNKYARSPAAAALGQKLYFDPAFAGTATQVDVLGRQAPYARAPANAPLLLSCATCHDPGRAGTDGTSVPGNVSVGAGLYDTNAPQTYNSAYAPLLFWSGRADSLWAGALSEVESPVAMNGNRLAIAWRLADAYPLDHDAAFPDAPLPAPFADGSAAYATRLGVSTSPSSANFNQCALGPGNTCPAGCRLVTNDVLGVSRCWPRFPLAGKPGLQPGCQAGDPTEPFDDAFDCMADADRPVATGLFVHYGKALEAYEYRLLSRLSPFDRFVTEGPASSILSDSAKRGARLFVGKAACVECHDTPLLSNGNPYNDAVPQVGPGVPTDADCPAGSLCDCAKGKNCLPWGAYDGLEKLQANKTFRRDGPWSDDPTDDSRAAWYSRSVDEGLINSWRTPSLRNVALSAPYMHDGVYKTLEDVVRAYNQGGTATGAPGRKAPQLQPLYLTDGEVADLTAFLESLTGAPLPKELVTPPPGLPPP